MLNVKAENIESRKDERVYESTKHYARLNPTDNLKTAFDSLKRFTYGGYTLTGRGGNHIWIVRKTDYKRIVIITTHRG